MGKLGTAQQSPAVGSCSKGMLIYHAIVFYTLLTRARKSIVSCYPGYQPTSNLAANSGWAEGTDWANGTVNHEGKVNSRSVAELNIYTDIKKNVQKIKNS